MKDESMAPPEDAPLPPPPPPPPPPQDELKKKKATPNLSQSQPLKPKKKKDFREILALFHEEGDAEKAKLVWSALWQTTLAESQEEHKRRRQQEQHGLKRKKNGDDHGPMSVRGLGSLSRHGSLTQDHLKRARQGSTASTDSSESGKGSRLGGRFPKNVPKGSKLMQKFGGRS